MRTQVNLLLLAFIFISFGQLTAQTVSVAIMNEKGNESFPRNEYQEKAAPLDPAVKNEEDAIRAVLLDYMEGTANGEPERIKNAFHSDLNLYSVAEDALQVLPGQKYISYFKSGEKRDRIGKIIFVDYVNDAATAKIEILVPSRKRVYTDYLLLLKVENEWKIIHKSYTFEPQAN